MQKETHTKESSNQTARFYRLCVQRSFKFKVYANKYSVGKWKVKSKLNTKGKTMPIQMHWKVLIIIDFSISKVQMHSDAFRCKSFIFVFFHNPCFGSYIITKSPFGAAFRCTNYSGVLQRNGWGRSWVRTILFITANANVNTKITNTDTKTNTNTNTNSLVVCATCAPPKRGRHW